MVGDKFKFMFKTCLVAYCQPFLQREFLLKMDAISVMVGFYLGTKASELVSVIQP